MPITKKDHEHCDGKEPEEGGCYQLRSQENELWPSLHIPPLLSAKHPPPNAGPLYGNAIRQRALLVSANSATDIQFLSLRIFTNPNFRSC